ncbi:MAG: heat-inducible transcriptional repressor HrcA [Defluviitaleaceae bacterium]|nr:heat-inducible transcriptional repressor HrcA [Defluviitaleaceae bacterium]MCL2239371.1 heat-inducible transcriptional repressor HrcA [Defluviitaleaceae bacterium]
MDLTERKFKILEAIVNDYIHTAEPIGSRTIAKKYGLGISSATIRNEMSDLEDLGLISQLHTSSGRVPSQKGYRFYVDRMMREQPLTGEESLFLQGMIIQNINQVEFMMQETAKALARLTRCPAIVSEPYLKKTKIRHLQLVPVDERAVLLVLITDTKAVKNQVVNLPDAPSYDTLARLTQTLNKHLEGKSVREIDRPCIDALLEAFGKQAHMLMPLLGIIAGMIQAEDDVRVFTSGVKNILAFPEFSDRSKADAIFQALEERESLISLLAPLSAGTSYEDIEIIIGDENDFDWLKDCSLVRAGYSIDNQSTGYIAIIGPTRMDYAHNLSVLTGISQNIRQVIQALGGSV